MTATVSDRQSGTKNHTGNHSTERPVVVVGTGPAGSMAAWLLARQGKKVILLEEHASVGDPIQCTGILTRSVLKATELSEQDIDSVTAFVAKGTWVYAPDGSHADIPLKGDYVVYRNAFDAMLARRAETAGATLLLRHRFVGIDKDTGEVLVEKKGAAATEGVAATGRPQISDTSAHRSAILRIKASALIGADGPRSLVAKAAGIYERDDLPGGAGMAGKRAFVNAPQTVVRHKHKGIIEFFPHKEVIAWIVPEGPDTVRAGMCTYGNPAEAFNAFQKQYLGNDYRARTIGHQGGIIPVYNPLLRTETVVRPADPGAQTGKTPSPGMRVLLIGDAATQVKPTTFGGIIQGATAARCAVDALIAGDSYERRWKKALHADLAMGLRLRHAMDTMSDAQFNKLIRLCGKPRVARIFRDHDRDYPTQFGLRLLAAEPRLLFLAIKMFK